MPLAGTHCAGVVSADTNNTIGVAGTAGGATGGGGAKLMILTVFGKQGTKGFAEAPTTLLLLHMQPNAPLLLPPLHTRFRTSA